MKRLFIVLISVLALSAQASGWLTSNKLSKIEYINAEANIVKVRVDGTDLKNPDGCGNAGTFILKGDTKNEDRQFSILMAAHMANKPVTLYGNGCVSGWGTTYPKISAVFVYE